MKKIILINCFLCIVCVISAQPTVIYDGTNAYSAPQSNHRAFDALNNWTPPPVPYNTLHIYGGSNHDQYLGCLNCSLYDSNSIWNQYGTYGSNYSNQSIWNNNGTYGNNYSDVSPWNSYASHPPVIVDKNGSFYGYLTTDMWRPQRADFDLVKYLCMYYDQIGNDVEGWYQKIFK